MAKSNKEDENKSKKPIRYLPLITLGDGLLGKGARKMKEKEQKNREYFEKKKK